MVTFINGGVIAFSKKVHVFMRHPVVSQFKLPCRITVSFVINIIENSEMISAYSQWPSSSKLTALSINE